MVRGPGRCAGPPVLRDPVFPCLSLLAEVWGLKPRKGGAADVQKTRTAYQPLLLRRSRKEAKKAERKRRRRETRLVIVLATILSLFFSGPTNFSFMPLVGAGAQSPARAVYGGVQRPGACMAYSHPPARAMQRLVQRERATQQHLLAACLPGTHACLQAWGVRWPLRIKSEASPMAGFCFLSGGSFVGFATPSIALPSSSSSSSLAQAGDGEERGREGEGRGGGRRRRPSSSASWRRSHLSSSHPRRAQRGEDAEDRGEGEGES